MRLDRPWDIADAYSPLDQALAAAFPNLRALCYEYRGLRPQKVGGGHGLEGEYSNPQLERAVTIGLGVGALIVITPRVTNGKESFSLGNYLRHIGRPEEAVGLGVIDHRADLEPQLESALAKIAKVLDSYATPILQGKDWIHVPFDWYGYK